MKTLLALLLCLVMLSDSRAQKRYLVTPNDEIIPIGIGGNPSSHMVSWKKNAPVGTSELCGSQYNFGYPQNLYPPQPVYAYRKDVLGVWFVAKATGTIDKIFWEQGTLVGAKDSTIYLRISQSNIGPDFGPGIRPGPYNPPCQSWGYWKNTNDLDEGVGAFPDEATDSTWVSAYNGATPSVPPFGNSLIAGSVAIIPTPGQVNSFTVTDAGSPLHVQAGDKFFISFKMRGGAGANAVTEFYGNYFRVSPTDEDYPSRLWKFYEHDSSVSNCAGVPQALSKGGWYARGGISQDSLDVGVVNIWYLMTPSANIPPDPYSPIGLQNTLSTDARLVNAEILDCDFESPPRAGVKLASLKWQLNGMNQPDIPMSLTGGQTWTAMIPGEPGGSIVSYRVYAEDSTGLSSTGKLFTYRIVQTANSYAQFVTSSSCSAKSIAGNSSNVIPPSEFYLPPGAPTGTNVLDDGTAGPFDLGSNMPIFGDAGRYMWIGINGAVAISKSATDTVDVNANGQFTNSWSFPYAGSVRHGGRSDTDGKLRMPGNFFAPFWANLWNGDSVGGAACGHIRFQKGYDGDTCVVVVEWDSLGYIPLYYGNLPECAMLTFRAIFNKCDATIEYQYDYTDYFRLSDEWAPDPLMIGFEADSTSLTEPQPASNGRPYVFINDHGFPISTSPVSGTCFKIYQSSVTASQAGWNLLSIGVHPPLDDYTKTALYPNATTAAFMFDGRYDYQTQLTNGKGIWMKFAAGENVGVRGEFLRHLTDSLRAGWNLIGTIGFPVAIAGISTVGTTLTSPYYEYDGGYRVATTLKPGLGYWIKASGTGSLAIDVDAVAATPKTEAQTNFSTMNSITIADFAGRRQTLFLAEEAALKEPRSFYQMPPAAPDFDARFSSGHLVETYPSHPEEAGIYQYPIHLETDAYPVTISWNIVTPATKRFILTGSDEKIKRTIMDGSGGFKITNARVNDLLITLGNDAGPSVYALHQNYPNPFNPSTEIRFSIRDAGRVTLRMFDVLGRETAVLVNEEKEPGEYSVTWDAANYASGIYFYELKAGSFREVKKMVFVR